MRKILVIAFILGVLAVLGLKSPVVCANSISCIKDLSLQIDNNALGYFNGQRVVPPKIDLKEAVLGEMVASSSGEKHIYVDLGKQTLYAYEGKELYMQAFISSGKWRPTPTGDFTIWSKLRATRMTGGQGADYYDLPNVPFVMFFANAKVPASSGFSLHGAYWHNNFGYPMSHGCVNMRITDAEKLFNWADKAPITIYD